MMLSEQQLEQFDRDGYLVLEKFFDPSDLFQEADKILDMMVHTQDVTQFQPFPFLYSSCNKKEPTKMEFDYFINSAHGIRLFLNNEINMKDFPIEFEQKKKMIRQMANRFGHALHAFNPVFKKFTFSKPIQTVIKSLSFKKPIVCQSMYILRQDFASSSDCGHQAATYINVEPSSRLVSFWLAMENSSNENGCLQFIPGSHKMGLQSKFIRNPNKSEYDEGRRLIYQNGDLTKYDENKYVSVPLKAGSMVLINSLVVHKSATCSKPMSRDVYAFHVYDSVDSKYSKDNWMEYNKETFLPLY